MKNQIPISRQDVETLIREHLPEIVRRDPSFRQWVLEVVAERFADKAETDSRFEQLLAELRAERQEFRKQWQEQRAQWREYQAQMEERWRGFLEGYERRWEEQRAEWREYQAQMEERWRGFLEGYERRREEQRAQWERHWKELLDHYERRWEEQRAESEKRFQQMLRRIDTGISAIGARWGIFAESAFRNGIQAILEESFGVQVLRYQGYDPDGEVFGRPDQVELDLIIRDGLLVVCEIKSSMSRSDMYTFERKVRFYERQEGRQAHRRIVISPMVEEKALRVAQELGIEVYSHADDVSL